METILPLVESKNITLAVEGADFELRSDPGCVRILLKNLLENALRYSSPGGEIVIALTAPAGAGCIQIPDNGPGVAEENLDQLFEPFFRAAPHHQPGSGLGLAIVKSLAQKLGCSVTLANQYTDDGAVSGFCAQVLFSEPHN